MLRYVSLLVSILVPSALVAQSPPQQLPRSDFITTMDGEYRKMDTNKDGQVTRAEVDGFQKAALRLQIQARQNAVFASLDIDRNGQLSAAEFAKMPVTPPRNNPDVIMRFDINRDGKVSLIEHRTATLVNFDRLDSDKDGIVSQVEMRTPQARP